jgi:hypothetical protein
LRVSETGNPSELEVSIMGKEKLTIKFGGGDFEARDWKMAMEEAAKFGANCEFSLPFHLESVELILLFSRYYVATSGFDCVSSTEISPIANLYRTSSDSSCSKSDKRNSLSRTRANALLPRAEH